VTTKSPRVRFALTAALIAVLVLVPTALAGKPGGGSGTGGSSSLSLVMFLDVTGNGLVNYGDTVTFIVSTTATSTPMVRTACTQNGAQVYYHEGGFYAGDPWAPYDQRFTMASSIWTSGAADCVATLYYNGRRGAQVDLKSISFHVDP